MIECIQLGLIASFILWMIATGGRGRRLFGILVLALPSLAHAAPPLGLASRFVCEVVRVPGNDQFPKELVGTYILEWEDDLDGWGYQDGDRLLVSLEFPLIAVGYPGGATPSGMVSLVFQWTNGGVTQSLRMLGGLSEVDASGATVNPVGTYVTANASETEQSPDGNEIVNATIFEDSIPNVGPGYAVGEPILLYVAWPPDGEWPGYYSNEDGSTVPMFPEFMLRQSIATNTITQTYNGASAGNAYWSFSESSGNRLSNTVRYLSGPASLNGFVQNGSFSNPYATFFPAYPAATVIQDWRNQRLSVGAHYYVGGPLRVPNFGAYGFFGFDAVQVNHVALTGTPVASTVSPVGAMPSGGAAQAARAERVANGRRERWSFLISSDYQGRAYLDWRRSSGTIRLYLYGSAAGMTDANMGSYRALDYFAYSRDGDMLLDRLSFDPSSPAHSFPKGGAFMYYDSIAPGTILPGPAPIAPPSSGGAFGSLPGAGELGEDDFPTTQPITETFADEVGGLMVDALDAAQAFKDTDPDRQFLRLMDTWGPAPNAAAAANYLYNFIVHVYPPAAAGSGETSNDMLKSVTGHTDFTWSICNLIYESIDQNADEYASILAWVKAINIAVILWWFYGFVSRWMFWAFDIAAPEALHFPGVPGTTMITGDIEIIEDGATSNSGYLLRPRR